MPAFDLALGLRLERRTTHVAHVLPIEIVGKIARDVTRAMVALRVVFDSAEQRQSLQHIGVIAARSVECHVERVGDVFSFRRRA